ncbi:MAG TPA: glycoside hydrolase family 76 protein [Streptosporangiaceae bacterium]
MGDRSGQGAGGGRRRSGSAARTAQMIIVVAVLVAIGVGHHKASAGRDPGPGEPAQPLAHGPASVFTTEASAAVAELNAQYSGAYLRTHLWQGANAIRATIDYMQATGSRAYLGDLTATYRAHHFTDGFLGPYYDDESWWALTWIRAYQLTRNPAYLQQAKSVFAAITRGWTPSCGGGLLWRENRPYKDAITNEVFLQDAVLLHELSPGDQYYREWALREWAWFSASGMLTPSHLVVDGVTQQCQAALGSPLWTYNQGALIGALVSLAGMTGNDSYLVTAGQVAHAVMNNPELSPAGILHDPCQRCGRDAPAFKGIFMDNLKLLYDRVGGADYQAYMHQNALAAWADDRRGRTLGISWAGPYIRTSMSAQAAGLDLLVTQIPPAGPASG